jgi:hypothetical protein
LNAAELESRAARFPHDGKGGAAYALAKARANLEAYKAAAFAYETAGAYRDAARVEANESKAGAASTAREGGAIYESWAQRVTETVAALALAETRHAATLKALSRARDACTPDGDTFGAGCWQSGAQSGNVAGAAWQSGATPRGMTPGDRGGQFFAYDGGGVVRNVRDAGDVVRLGHNGWFDNPHGESFRDGSGLVVGVVGQLRARDGRAVYVPGWRLGDSADAGVQFDLRAVELADGREESDGEEAAERAARVADGMAETVAETESDYKTAWGAGQAWATAGERLATVRASVRAILSERKAAAKTGASWPTLCEAIRARVDSLLAERRELIAERAALADGEDSTWGFYPDADARAAFCDGAELVRFPG